MKRLFVILTIGLLYTPISLFSQACCSGGVPFLGALEVSTIPAKNLQLSLTYDYNRLSRVYSGTDYLEVDPNQRRRIGQAVLLRGSYGFSSRIATTVVVSVIQQQRRITAGGTGNTDFIKAQGIGDAAALIKYSFIPFNMMSQRELSLSAGVKIPLGANDLTSDGIRVSEDLQPGSGAWDAIIGGYIAKGFMPTVPITAFFRSSFRVTGTNSIGYKFGNEFVASIGANYAPKSIINYSLLFRYRSVTADKRNNAVLPNSGGNWLYVIPGLNFNLTPSMGVRFSGQFPIYRNLDGTQLTTTYRLSASFFYVLF